MENPKGKGRILWGLIIIAITLVLLDVAHAFIGTILVGFFFYYASRPIYKRLRKKVPNRIAAVSSLTLLVFPVILLLWYGTSIAYKELQVFVATELNKVREILPGFLGLEKSINKISELIISPQSFISVTSISSASSYFTEILGYVGFAGFVLMNIIAAVIISYYLLKDGEKIPTYITNQYEISQVTKQFFKEVDEDLERLFFGNMLNAILTSLIGVATYTILALIAPNPLEVSYPTLIGLLTGVASLIPVLGMKIVYIPYTGYIIYQMSKLQNPTEFFWFPILFVSVSIVIVDVIPDLILRPYISGRRLHLGLIILAYMFGPLIWGWYGLFLGPVLLITFTHMMKIVLPSITDNHSVF